MNLKTHYLAALAPALGLILASPAFAEGKGDRAQIAMAAAQAKLDAPAIPHVRRRSGTRVAA